MTKATRTRGLILMGALLLTATVANAGGRCYTAQIPQTMVLPDGSTHAPGVLRICKEKTISPASSLHTSDVAGRPVGMFLSVPRDVEMSVEEGKALFVFKRSIRDEIELVGYAVSDGSGTTFFDMGRYGATRTAAGVPILDPNGSDDTVVLIAGR